MTLSRVGQYEQGAPRMSGIAPPGYPREAPVLGTDRGMGDDGRVAADKKRGTQTMRDMVLSLAVILLAAGVIYLFIPHDADRNPVKTVDYRVELSTARRAAPYPIAAPDGLPTGWRATSVTYDASSDKGGAAWHLGFLTGKDQYAAVEQSDARPTAYVEKVDAGRAEDRPAAAPSTATAGCAGTATSTTRWCAAATAGPRSSPARPRWTSWPNWPVRSPRAARRTPKHGHAQA